MGRAGRAQTAAVPARRGAILRGMTDAHRDEMRDDAPVGPVTLTTGRIAEDAVGALAAALGAAGVAVERRAFLPTRADETPPWGALLLAVGGHRPRARHRCPGYHAHPRDVTPHRVASIAA